MKASETKLSRIIEGTNQYLVPHFQRPYSWQQKNWDTLWSDLLNLLELEKNKDSAIEHFMGAIVTVPSSSVPEGVTKYLLIDGQQRLTTLFLILTVIRDKAKLMGEEKLPSKIHDLYLINRYHDGLDQYKLLPTQGYNPDHSDRTAFIEIIDNKNSDHGSENIHSAYSYFNKQLKALSIDEIEKLANIIVNRLFLVSIVLEKNDNPYTIFESLNAKGQPLTQSDLVRNYFFMCIEAKDHDLIYLNKWIPMEKTVGRENMESFVRHYLIKDGSFVRESDVYYRLKKKVDEIGSRSALSVLNELVKYSEYYAEFIHPEKEENNEIRNGLEKLLRFRVTVSYPFLLNVFNDYYSGAISDIEVVEILNIIENFIVRRYVCGTIRAELNEVFTSLYEKVLKFSRFVQGVRDILASRNYPSDNEFIEALKSKKIYSTGGEVRDRAKLILERIEGTWSTKEYVNTESLTIEHIMPQTLSDSWKLYLGDEAEEVHEIYLHTIGNLTLTGYNSEMSNISFDKKKEMLKKSKLLMNHEICEYQSWNKDSIEKRASFLADRALVIWPSIVLKSDSVTLKDVTGTTPKNLVILGKNYGISSWQEVLKITLQSIAELGIDVIIQLTKEYPRYINDKTDNMRNPKQLISNIYYESHMTAEKIHKLCIQVTQVAGLSSEEWYVITE